MGNALESISRNPNSVGQYGGLTINMVGPAYNALKADGLLSSLQGRDKMSEAEARVKEIQYQSHKDDFVGTVLGGNKPTGGDRPEGTTKWGQYLNILTGTETPHNCYVSGSEACRDAGFWNSLPGGNAQYFPASYQKNK